jgi:hypothetical protein
MMEEGAGEVKSEVPGSGVERSRDGTQNKAAGRAGSAVGAGIAVAALRRNCAMRRGEREIRSLFIFKWTVRRSKLDVV